MANSTYGYVYFVHAPKLMMVKIGYTGGDPIVRLKSLDIASPVPLVLLGFRRGSRDSELWIQKKFVMFRERREWFRYQGALRKWIETQLAGPPQEWLDDGPQFDELRYDIEQRINERAFGDRRVEAGLPREYEEKLIHIR